MPRGGKREGAGRKEGSTHSTKKFISKQARKYGEEALRTLVKNMADENGTISNAAAKTILEYGFGKPTTEITGADGDALFKNITVKIVGNDRDT